MAAAVIRHSALPGRLNSPWSCRSRDALLPVQAGLPEGFGRWKHQLWERQGQELFFTLSLTETLAVMCWVSFCLLPPLNLLTTSSSQWCTQSQEEPGRCTDRSSSHCCSSILSQHDGGGRSCPQPQQQTSENPHLNTTLQSQLPKSCCWGNALLSPALSPGRRMCALGSLHRNLASGIATRLHHQGWKTPGLVLDPSPKGSNPWSYPGPPTPDPPVVSSPSCSCLPCSCSAPATSQTSSQHRLDLQPLTPNTGATRPPLP